MIKIRVFRADLEPEDCFRYVEGHQKVLEAYGVTKVTSANLSWTKEPYTYLIVVESIDSGRVMGGGRIQLTGGTVPLPIEMAINTLDTHIFDLVKEKTQFRTGEYCGLWNSKEIAGYGVGSIILMRVGMAVLSQLKVGSLFAFGSPATLDKSMSVGYRIINSLGINGTFYYPKEDLLATALIIEDPLELKNASPDERIKIFDLRNNPVQKTIEHGPKGAIEVEYNLRLDNIF